MARTTHVHRGRDDVAAKRAKERRRQQREANGYQKGKHIEKDTKLTRKRYSDRSKELFEQALNIFKEYVEKYDPLKNFVYVDDDHRYMAEEEGISEEESVRPGREAPSISLWKEHMRWYANSAKGKLRDRPTKSTTLNHAERVFVAFTAATGTEINLEDRCEIYAVRVPCTQ